MAKTFVTIQLLNKILHGKIKVYKRSESVVYQSVFIFLHMLYSSKFETNNFAHNYYVDLLYLKLQYTETLTLIRIQFPCLFFDASNPLRVAYKF